MTETLINCHRGNMASFDFAPLALRYAQDEREIGLFPFVLSPSTSSGQA